MSENASEFDLNINPIDWTGVDVVIAKKDSYRLRVPDTLTARQIGLAIALKLGPNLKQEHERRFKNPKALSGWDECRMDGMDTSYTESPITDEGDPNFGKVEINLFLRDFADRPDYIQRLKEAVEFVVPRKKFPPQAA